MEWIVKALGGFIAGKTPTEIVSLMFITLMFTIFIIKGTLKAVELTSKAKTLSQPQPVIQHVFDQRLWDQLHDLTTQLSLVKDQVVILEAHTTKTVDSSKSEIIDLLQKAQHLLIVISDSIKHGAGEHQHIRSLIEKIDTTLHQQLQDVRNDVREVDRSVSDVSKDIALLQGNINTLSNFSKRTSLK